MHEAKQANAAQFMASCFIFKNPVTASISRDWIFCCLLIPNEFGKEQAFTAAKAHILYQME
ncbi:hypothetical protein AB4Z29_25610 [Paenibacillus sp. 2TAB23]|uniref:hypothetical protein n=1 Tax=Paenibacillus sp. 2TAB23 TaxID=3233004 RepID=UPI003F9B194E